MTSPLFSLDSVTFRYRPHRPPVLEAFSRCFHPGITLLRGPSGGGKSTLLKLLAGFLTPDSGTIRTLRGRAPDEAFIRHDLGFVFQQFNLLPAATLRENLVLSAFASLQPAPRADAAIRHWLQRLALEPFAEAPAGDLSGGQLQRAAIARALIKSPALLLLDEPTSGLDDRNTETIAQVLAEAWGSGTSVIVSTHDPRLSGLFPAADTEQLPPA